MAIRRAWNRIGCAAAFAAVSLMGCERKETGPEPAEVAAEAPATATPVPPAVTDPAAIRRLLGFAGMDEDGDGRVTSAEQAKASQAIFQAMDADGDGTVTLPEMDAARAAMGDTPDLASEKLIKSADADYDGKLTLGEWVAASNARFTRFDADTDGAIDPAEWRAGIAADAATGPALPPKR